MYRTLLKISGIYGSYIIYNVHIPADFTDSAGGLVPSSLRHSDVGTRVSPRGIWEGGGGFKGL